MKKVVRRVSIPSHLQRDLGGNSQPFSVGEDQRRFARRPSNLFAQLEVVQAWSPDCDCGFLFEVPVSNVSRSGVCFYHHEQLFPDDEVNIDFGNLRRKFQITRCRRLGDLCYEIGAQVAG